MSSKVFRAQCKFILPLAAALMSACAERVADSPNVPLTSTPLAALTAESARTVRFAFDQATSAVTTIRGRFAVAPAADSPAAARGFLTRHAQALRLREDLTDLHLARHTQDPGGEVLAFAQRHQGVRVVGADVVVGFDPTGAIIHVQNDTVPDLTLSTQPKLAAERALALASQHLGHELLGATARLVIVRGDKASPGYHLAFEVAGLVSKPRSDWFIYVDARSGNIVRARNRIKSTGAACTPCTPGAAGCGLVFEYDPVSALNDTTLLDTSNVDIAMRGCVLNNLTSATNLNGTWVNTSITATRATAPFNYARSASQQKADEVTVYYHLNRAKEYLNAMGYPGVMNFSINTDAHDPTLGDNAHYVPSTKILEFGEGGTDDAHQKYP